MSITPIRAGVPVLALMNAEEQRAMLFQRRHELEVLASLVVAEWKAMKGRMEALERNGMLINDALLECDEQIGGCGHG